ncbi:Cysteine protease ATG4C [Halotydeus destructor]|nr:Cysteine protease ATG4C [Halotydeus destructor]
MLTRKYETRASEVSSPSRTSTLPSLFGVTRGTSSSIDSRQSKASPVLSKSARYVQQRAMSTPGAAPILCRLETFNQRRPSKGDPMNVAPVAVNERCVDSYQDILSQYDNGRVRKVSSSKTSQNGDSEESEESNGEKVKARLMSMWNNVKYGWNVKLKTTFSTDAPIWFLGVMYHRNLVENGPNRPRNSSTSQYNLNQQRDKESALERFKQDYYSRIWLTYRRAFPRIDNSLWTTDCGWGCMIRSGQMILAHAFLVHYLGRSWRWLGSQSDKNDMIHRMIIKWFLDEPEAPFSLHKLVRIGSAMGKKPGDWYGPATISYILSQAMSEAFLENPILENVTSYVAQDCTVYIDDIIKLCTQETSSRRRASASKLHARSRASSVVSNLPAIESEMVKIAHAEEQLRKELISESNSRSRDQVVPPRTESILNRGSRSRHSFLAAKAASTINLYDGPSGPISAASSQTEDSGIGLDNKTRQSVTEAVEKWRGIVLFIPVRLGGEKFNPVYTECVRNLFSHPSTLGIIGGRPRHSLFFVGCQDDKLIYLDPHLCQDAVESTTFNVNFPLDSFHCNDPRKMPINKMDPSCTIAFYCQSRDDFNSLIQSAKSFTVAGQKHTDYPIFVFADGSSPPVQEAADKFTERLLKVKHRYIDSQGNVEAESLSDDFVLIS